MVVVSVQTTADEWDDGGWWKGMTAVDDGCGWLWKSSGRAASRAKGGGVGGDGDSPLAALPSCHVSVVDGGAGCALSLCVVIGGIALEGIRFDSIGADEK